MMKKRLSILFFFLLTFSFVHTTSAYAASGSDFSVEALTASGTANEKGFYHFIGTPGESEPFKIKITNYSDEEITIDVGVHSASTNENGLTSYLAQKTFDDSLINKTEDLVTLDKDKLTVAPHYTTFLTGTVMYPKSDWSGDILGGIRFTKETDKKTKETITHEYAYTIGLLLNMKEGATVENELALHSVNANQRNLRNFIEANIQNSAAVMIKEMSIEANIFKEGTSNSVYHYTVSDMRMAPNSNFDFGIPTGDVPLQSGAYKLTMHVNADGKTYDFTKSFELSAREVRQLNASAVNLPSNSTNLFVKILAGAVLLIIPLLLILSNLHKRRAADKNYPICK